MCYQVNKFVEFCEIHDLVADPAHLEFEYFNTDLLDSYLSWLIKYGKNGKPLLSHHVCISGIKCFLERKFPEKKLLPFKSVTTWCTQIRRKASK